MESEGNNSKKVIVTVAIIIVIALLGFSAKALTSDKEQKSKASTTPITQSTVTTASPTAVSTNAAFKDGIYTSAGDYRSPGGTEKISVTVTVKNGTVTQSEVSQEANNRDSEEYQAEFKNNYKEKVVGQKLSDIMLSNVSGSSLTSEGFNDALEAIRTQASVQS